MVGRALLILALGLLAVRPATGEITEVDGVRYECADGMCRPVAGSGLAAGLPDTEEDDDGEGESRLLQGYADAETFLAFLENREAEKGDDTGRLALAGPFTLVLLVLLGGLAMNLTPCVLPMMPINLMIIGRSAVRGAAYGAGIALAYGALGVLAALGGVAFGSIQSNPWFNLAVAAVFAALALALSGVWFLDFSRFRTSVGRRGSSAAFAFGMGALSATLAGSCVAPILVSVLVLTAKGAGEGRWWTLALPFVLGLGMALPWPLVAAGLKVLPKPGAWMKWVDRAFAAVVLLLAAHYARLAWRGFRPVAATLTEVTEATFSLEGLERPVLVDCGAEWCKNCAAMEREVLTASRVRAALSRFTVIRLRVGDLAALRALPGFEGVRGLPAFVIFE